MNGILSYVAAHALGEADDLDRDADELSRKAAAKRHLAEGLRALHGVASQYVKPTSLHLMAKTGASA